MALPYPYAIDFTPYRKDLLEQALNRMLSQHYDKCVLRQFVAAIIDEAQRAYDAIIDMQEQRIVYNAEGENLNALGRIVGEDRKPWTYDDSTWLFFDRQGQGYDQVVMWCINAPLGRYVEVEDQQYRINIIAKAIKNHTLVASIPEITYLINYLFDINVSYEKTGPNEVRIIVPDNISTTQLRLLTQSYTDNRVDESYYIPYPATLSFSEVLMFGATGYFMFDRDNRCFDVAPLAVGVNYDWNPQPGE